MGKPNDGYHATIEGIQQASPEDKCDVCGRERDVAQIICTMEGPDPEMGGLANMVFICSYCCARAIQAATGFKMVKQLNNWYRIRDAYPKLHPNVYHKVEPEDISIG